MSRSFPLESDLQDPAVSYSSRTRLHSSTQPLCRLLQDDPVGSIFDGNPLRRENSREGGHSEKTEQIPVFSLAAPADVYISHELPHQPYPSPTHPSADGSKEDHWRTTTVTGGNTVSLIVPPLQERLKPRFTSAFFTFFTLGWADGVTGTLLSHFEADLHLNYMSSSLFFVASATGYSLGTLLVEFVTRSLGRYNLSADTVTPDATLASRFLKRGAHKHAADRPVPGYSLSQSRFLTLVLASMLHAMFFVIMGARRGFASMLVAYVISAFARSFMTGMNLYVSSTPKKALGYIYGTWAIGAFCAPLVCQSVIATGIPWAHFYLGSLVVSTLNTSIIIFAFWPTGNELWRETTLLHEEMKSHEIASPTTCDEKSRQPSSGADGANSSSILIPTADPRGGLRRIMKIPSLWTNSVFACLYTGAESSTQGYIVLYLLNTRNANSKTVGYVTSGFWGGMAISRLVWGHVSFRLSFTQRKWIVQSCILIALTMHLLIWFVRSFAENAFSTALIGVVYGPIYPSNLALANDLLPVDLHMVSMAVIAAFASFGAALFPFITGTLSNLKGAHILPYVTVAQTATMFCLWALFPSRQPRKANHQGAP